MFLVPRHRIEKIVQREKHYCTIRRGGKVISTGNNKPWAFNFQGKSYRLHAECDALRNIPKKYIKTKKSVIFTLTVVKVKPGTSRPCNDCIEFMQKFCNFHDIKIKEVCYSEDNCIYSENISSMEKVYYSFYSRVVDKK